MAKFFNVFFKVLVILTGGSVILYACLIGFLMLTEFSPAKHFAPGIKGNGRAFEPSRREFTFFTWNIGYAGLGRGSDFFYDGGKMVIPAQEQCSQYFDGIKALVKSCDTVDFIFLQEIDLYAKRSWYTNEVDSFAALLQGFSSVYATNYDCRFVPAPIHDPMGRVVSGLASYSSFMPSKAEVQYYNAYFPWPKRLVMLKRCFIMLRFGLDNRKELVVINTHNSAYDSTGSLRKRELAMLDSVMRSEYQKGNYVIAGGDWNNNPRGCDVSSMISGDLVTGVDPPIGFDFLPGWQFVFDIGKPTNRYLNMPYKKGATKTTIIDFFVVSPNVEVKNVATIPMGFAYSDHEPVVMGVRLKQE